MAKPLPRLRVSENRRFLVSAPEGAPDGGVASGAPEQPFFYLGDTAWELFHRLTREEIDHYLRDRAARGFTVIQAVALAEFDGIREPNAYGHTPFDGDGPEGFNEPYWRHVEWAIERAAELGLYVGLLPTWGDKWNRGHGIGPEIFTPQNAGAYGRALAERFSRHSLIWILGGDRPFQNAAHLATVRAMAAGIREIDRGRNLMTFHPHGGGASSEWLHDDDWLDFNMRQNGHAVEHTGRYDRTIEDTHRLPTKPVIDGEPIYEDHPIAFRAAEFGHSIAADVRRPLYWDLFAGACGHTYGHHSVWQMWEPGRKPINNPLLPWREALGQPGAAQMIHGRRLIESRPILTRIPDDSMIVEHAAPTAIPGAGRLRLAGTRDLDRTFAMIYAPTGRPFDVRMDAVRGDVIRAWWFNPRTGTAQILDEFPSGGTRRFHPPDPGEYLDSVLVLDDAAQGYPAPGAAIGESGTPLG